MLKSIVSEYRDYARIHSEVVLYSDKYGVAGTSDNVFEVSTKGNFCDVSDFKTNISKGIQFFDPYGKFMLEPVSHLSSANYQKYSLQMSIYGVMIEDLFKKKIRQLWIHFVPKDNPLDHKRIPCPFLRTDAIAVLEHFQAQRDKVKGELIDTYQEPTF